MSPHPLGRAEAGARDQEHAPVERASPGLGALFAGMRGGGHAILDLGPARPAHVRVLGPYAGQIRFWELTQAGGGAPAEAIRGLPANPSSPYDVVLAWDVLDCLEADDRRALMARLADVTAPGARMFFMVDASGSRTRRTWNFTLMEAGKLIQTEAGPPMPASPELLPAAVERLIVPFEVQSAFYVRSGWREYVVRRR